MNGTLLIPIAMGSITLSSANPVYSRVFLPLRVVQVGFVVTTALTTTAAVVTFGIVEADTTAADPAGTSVLGTCTATSTTMAANNGVFNNVEEVQGARRILYPGEAIIASATTTAAAGVVQAFAVVEYLGFANVDMRLTTVPAHAGGNQRPLALSMMTKVIV